MKRRILIISIFLLFGVVINVAVAWWCALWLPMEYVVPLSENQVRQRIPPDVTVRSDLFFFHGMEIEQHGRFILTLVGTEVGSRGVDSAVPLYLRCESGWPVFSLAGTYRMTVNGLETSYLLFVPESLFDRVEHYYIPLGATWPGFAINTLLYGGVPWLLICGPFELRRYRRRKRGLCVHCAYPIGESDVCTECGRAIALQRRPSP